MAKTFDDLVQRTTSKRTRQRAAGRAQALLGELLISEMRKLRGKSQYALAHDLGIKQPSLSKLENQSDMQISTLQRIIAALGGELEVIAKFPRGRVRMRQFEKTNRPGGRRAKELQLV